MAPPMKTEKDIKADVARARMIADQLSRGDESGFNELHAELHPFVRAFIINRQRNSTAEDLTNIEDNFWRQVSKDGGKPLRSYEGLGGASLKTFLTTILKRQGYNHVRNLNKRVPIVSGERDAEGGGSETIDEPSGHEDPPEGRFNPDDASDPDEDTASPSGFKLREMELDDDVFVESCEGSLIEEENRAILESFMAAALMEFGKLYPDDYNVVIQRYFNDTPMKDIARLMGMEPNTLTQRLTRKKFGSLPRLGAIIKQRLLERPHLVRIDAIRAAIDADLASELAMRAAWEACLRVALERMSRTHPDDARKVFSRIKSCHRQTPALLLNELNGSGQPPRIVRFRETLSQVMRERGIKPALIASSGNCSGECHNTAVKTDKTARRRARDARGME